MNPKVREDYEQGRQCLHCRWYNKLPGKLGMDYGCCTNQESPFWYVVVFEHHTCERYQPEGQETLLNLRGSIKPHGHPEDFHKARQQVKRRIARKVARD